MDFFKKVVASVSKDEDRARSEFIFHILLVSIIGLTLVTFVINLFDYLRGLDPVFPAWLISIVVLVFLGLFLLSKHGYSLLSSWIFCGIFFILNSLTALNHGIDVPACVLTYALIIIMIGILVSTRAAFITTGLIVLLISALGWLQLNDFSFDEYWRNSLFTVSDIIVFSVMFLIIATVSWLSNREIEKSLHRARRSEAELKQERDLLEVKVEERTRELKQIQLDKMGQLYRFAEFGRLSSGLFHDLVNPLTAVSLNMEIAKAKEIHEHDSAASKTYIDRALVAAHKMEDFVTSVRKQISKQEHRALFSVNEEIEQILEILAFKAKRLNVSFRFEADSIVMVDGDNIKLSQVFLNLITNALDSYVSVKRDADRVIIIKLTKTDSEVICSVTDNGSGMDEATMHRIFEPFFSTKGSDASMGIGLSLVKHIIEKDFSGTIHVTSNFGHGSTFKIQIPHGIKHEQSHQTGD